MTRIRVCSAGAITLVLALAAPTIASADQQSSLLGSQQQGGSGGQQQSSLLSSQQQSGGGSSGSSGSGGQQQSGLGSSQQQSGSGSSGSSGSGGQQQSGLGSSQQQSGSGSSGSSGSGGQQESGLGSSQQQSGSGSSGSSGSGGQQQSGLGSSSSSRAVGPGFLGVRRPAGVGAAQFPAAAREWAVGIGWSAADQPRRRSAARRLDRNPAVLRADWHAAITGWRRPAELRRRSAAAGRFDSVAAVVPRPGKSAVRPGWAGAILPCRWRTAEPRWSTAGTPSGFAAAAQFAWFRWPAAVGTGDVATAGQLVGQSTVRLVEFSAGVG